MVTKISSLSRCNRQRNSIDHHLLSVTRQTKFITVNMQKRKRNYLYTCSLLLHQPLLRENIDNLLDMIMLTMNTDYKDVFRTKDIHYYCIAT